MQPLAEDNKLTRSTLLEVGQAIKQCASELSGWLNGSDGVIKLIRGCFCFLGGGWPGHFEVVNRLLSAPPQHFYEPYMVSAPTAVPIP